MPRQSKRQLDLSAAEVPAKAARKPPTEKQLADYQKRYQAAVNGTARWLRRLRLASTKLSKHQKEAARLEKLLRVFPLR